MDEVQKELELLSEVDKSISDKKEQNRIASDLKDYPNEYCIKIIETEPFLWDMRCWNKCHDRDEVMAYLQKEELDYLNAGHCVFCIRLLKERGLHLEEIAEAMLRNNKIQYKNRIVRCFGDTAENCPKYKEFRFPKCQECE